MLTKDKIVQLEPLTNHPKFGKLLADAIEVWKVADPIQNEFGVIRNTKKDEDGFEVYEDHLDFMYEKPSCCLIGAAAINKIDKNSDLEDGEYAEHICHKVFDLQYHDLSALILGFDGSVTTFNDSEAYQFASEVRKIIFSD